MKLASRWVPIAATSPSGKQMFVCLCCGSRTTAPSSDCPKVRTAVGIETGCAAWEGTLEGQVALQKVASTLHNADIGRLQRIVLEHVRRRLGNMQGKTPITFSRVRALIEYELQYVTNAGVPASFVDEMRENIETLLVNSIRFDTLEAVVSPRQDAPEDEEGKSAP